jgi:Tfp pilus assembly protein PilV
MGDGIYQAIIAGKRHYLSSIGEKERAMKGISRLLQQGSPLKTKGPEGAEQGTRADGEDDGSLSGGNNSGGGDQTGVETTPAAEEEDSDNAPLTEVAILKGLLTEADTGDAVLFESALVYAWYKVTGLPMPKDAILPAELAKLKSNKKMVNAAIQAVQKLNLGTGKSARATGRSGEKATLTDFWKSQGASNTTPKTDVILGNKKISVKAGNSQLMSGGKNESLATFYAAAKKVPGILKTKEAQDVIKTFEKFVEGGYTKAGSVEKELTSGKNKVLKDGDKAHKEMKTKLQDLFNKSPKFKIAFAKEAMSGYEKFGPKSPASADYVLSVDSGFGSPKLHSTQNDSYAAKIADQMNLTVRFKSTSQKIGGEKTGKYRFWSVVSLISDPTKLKEGISDTIKNAYNSVKNFINQGIYSLTKFVMGDDEIDVELNNTIDFS